MVKREPLFTAAPLYSVIIATYNDWSFLDRCLRSLAEEANAPSFEVIIVDDGSKVPAPEFIHCWGEAYPLTVLRQPHGGIATARNQGIRVSKGSVLVFVDADCKLQADCLSALASTIAQSPQHNCFQLHLIGDCSGLVGRAEELRLMTIQNHQLQPNGCIRYLNTAGFAIRKNSVDVGGHVFDPAALRSEDTLLLANLMQAGHLPLFVPNAVVQHAIPLTLMGCFLKDIRSAYWERKTMDLIAAKGVRIRVSDRERLGMLSTMWRSSKRQSIGRMAWFVVIARRSLRRFFTVAYSFFRTRPTSRVPAIPL